jgi:hypothetical protein
MAMIPIVFCASLPAVTQAVHRRGNELQPPEPAIDLLRPRTKEEMRDDRHEQHT